MKISVKLLLAYFVAMVITTSCSTQQHLAPAGNGQKIDLRLVGNWEGSEEDNQIKGMTKQWKMMRSKDGRFVLDFSATIEGTTQQFVEEGSWWVKDGKFYELHENSGKTDTYEYEVLNENQIKFKSTNLGIAHENQAYEFIDTRVK